MTEPNGTASGEVRGEPARPDLARRIANRLKGAYLLSAHHHATDQEAELLIRESLAPIREALETLRPEDMGDQQVVDYALRLLRGEELSGNRGVGGGE